MIKKELRLSNIFICIILLLILSVSNAESAKSVIRILHVNDFHGFAEPYIPLGSHELRGGISYLAGEVERLRAEKPTLLLAAGDMISGNNWANLFKGRSSIEVMNAMRFDAMAPGNHEFDFGIEVLEKRISEAEFPVLASNVKGLGPIMKPYIIREIGGVKVAIIGVVTDETPVTTNPANVAGLTFGLPEAAVERYLRELEGKADIKIVLSHIGHSNDRLLAEKMKGIHVIVGGHSHTKVSKPEVVGGTIIVQAWEHAKALGVLDITVEDGVVKSFEGHLVEISPSEGKADLKVEDIVSKYQKKVSALMDERIGFAGADLDGEDVRFKETNLGDLVADIMRGTSGADAAIINGGTIRTSIHKGEIIIGDIYSVLPFDNYIVAVRLTGGQIRQALEHGVSAVEQREGRFPQISGIAFIYSRSAPAGKRVREISIHGRPVEMSKEYTVATNDFLAAGGDGYKVFGDAVRSSRDFSVTGGALKGEKLVYCDSGRWLRDVVIEYIKKEKTVSPEVEGRIKELP